MCLSQLIRVAFEEGSLPTPGSNICHTRARWSAYTDRMPFFREVEGFHNWLFYLYSDRLGEIKYLRHFTEIRPWRHGKGERVSYILREGDLSECHITFFIIINQRLWCYRNTVLNL